MRKGLSSQIGGTSFLDLVLPHKEVEGEFASLNPLFLLFPPKGSLKQALPGPGDPADSCLLT